MTSIYNPSAALGGLSGAPAQSPAMSQYLLLRQLLNSYGGTNGAQIPGAQQPTQAPGMVAAQPSADQLRALLVSLGSLPSAQQPPTASPAAFLGTRG